MRYTRQAPIAILALAMLALSACNANSVISKAINRHASGTGFSLTGQRAHIMSQAKDAGALDSSKVLTLSIGLPLRNQAKLRALLANQYDPNSPLYHDFLTPDQFRQDYSPTDQTVSEVEDYLTASGLTNPHASSSHQFIDVQGKVSDIESAFHVQLHKYTFHGKDYYGPVSDPAVSSNLAGLVQNISGLDNFSVYHPAMQLRPQAQGQGYSASDIEKAYDTTGLSDGSGQSIAFLELSDYQASDIQQYQQQNNLPSNNPQTIQVDGGAQLDDGTPEVELDLEVADAMAPKATQLVYEGPNSGQGINDVYSQIVNDDKAKIVSISWGLCEQSTGSAELQTLDQIFAQGASEGIAFFAAAGDDGAYDCGDNNLAVDSPADDPNVTGVGGTSLTLNGSSYGSEKAWSCTDSNCTQQAPNGSGGGGGVSQQFTLPKYQQGLNPAGASGTSNRFVPDVSADADPQTGYAIICSASQASQDCTGNLTVGGTSAAAPAWAGSAALINQYLNSKGKSVLGNANSTLYAVGDNSGAFHDVTSGDNLHYQAGSGYDLATGLGSPDVTKLAQAIANGNFGTGTGTGSPAPTPTPGGNPTPAPGGGGGSGNGSELLTNNGFENGANPWGQSSQGGYDLIDTENPHQGSYSADLCGYASCDDVIAQAFVVPQGANHLSVSYFWNMITDKDSSTCSDHLTVSIYSVQDDGSGNLTLGNSITTIQNDCNQAANSDFAQKTKDISSILQSQAGQTVAIVFEGKTDSDGQNTTRYFVDDVSVQAG
jgi:subtilase family serine protease